MRSLPVSTRDTLTLTLPPQEPHMPGNPPPPPGADAHHHEPILYSGGPVDTAGDPIDEGDGHDGRHRPAMAPRLRGLPVLFLSHGAQVYAGGAPFTDWTTVEDLASRKEVRAAERRLAEHSEPLPDAFVFFNEARTQVKILIWSDRGFTVLHQRLDEGMFTLGRNVAPGEKIPVEDLGRMFSGTARVSAPVQAQPQAAEPAPPGLH